MNIFILDTDPAIAASYHCDQHLHKMILESAQMLSNTIHTIYPHWTKYVYKPAYTRHPCTQWLINSRSACLWTIKLCEALDDIRMSLGYDSHRSMQIVKIAKDVMTSSPEDPKHLDPLHFRFGGPAYLKLQPQLTPVQKYQKYYRYKHRQWLDTAHPMTYKDRPIPPFMQDLFAS